MARIVTGVLTGTFNLGTHLDPQTLDLYGPRELISTPAFTAGGTSFPAYVAANPKLTFDATYLATLANGLKVAAGSSTGDGVATSATFVNFRSVSFVDSTRSANNKVCESVWSGGVLTGRFLNDSYSAATNWLEVTGGQAAGISSISFGATISPLTDNNRDCGAPSFRWAVVRAGTGTINTSDARDKTVVEPLSAQEIDAAQQLAEEIGSFSFIDSIAQKGAAARRHIGMTVQRAMEIMRSNGLEPLRYAFICHDEWPACTVQHEAQFGPHESLVDEEGNPLQVQTQAAWVETISGGDRYGFRADQLYAFILRGQVARQRQLYARLAALEAMLAGKA